MFCANHLNVLLQKVSQKVGSSFTFTFLSVVACDKIVVYMYGMPHTVDILLITFTDR